MFKHQDAADAIMAEACKDMTPEEAAGFRVAAYAEGFFDTLDANIDAGLKNGFTVQQQIDVTIAAMREREKKHG